jgi:hypothetical protein
MKEIVTYMEVNRKGESQAINYIAATKVIDFALKNTPSSTSSNVADGCRHYAFKISNSPIIDIMARKTDVPLKVYHS